MKKIINIFLMFIICLNFTCCTNSGLINTPPDNTAEAIGEDFMKIDNYNTEKVITEPTFNIDTTVNEDVNAFKLASMISDNMVLQRNAVNCIWGSCMADGGVAVVINNKTFYGNAIDKQFKIYTAPMESGGPYTLTVYDNFSKYTITNVMIGEVIFFSGQSNMHWTMGNTAYYGKQYLRLGAYIPTQSADADTYGSYLINEDIRKYYRDLAANEIEPDNKIRLCNLFSGIESDLQIGGNTTPQTDIVCEWTEADTENINKASMFAYYFAKNLQAKTNLIIGVVMGAWGGTEVPAWTPRDVYDKYCSGNPHNNENIYFYGNNDSNDKVNSISRCYNTFISPILNYKFKAVVWYQGEGQAQKYAESVVKLIESWRTNMDNPNMGFLIVELPRFGANDTYKSGTTAEEYKNGDVNTGILSLLYFNCREQQKLITSLTDNCAMSVSVNDGDYDDIHPSDKRIIAKQSADKFIEYFYKSKEILSGPQISVSAKASGGAVIVFKNTGSGIELRNGGINFEISEDGETYYEAKAEYLSENQIFIPIGNADVSEINYIRYGALNYPRVTRLEMSKYVSLFNSKGYPCDQFLIQTE